MSLWKIYTEGVCDVDLAGILLFVAQLWKYEMIWFEENLWMWLWSVFIMNWQQYSDFSCRIVLPIPLQCFFNMRKKKFWARDKFFMDSSSKLVILLSYFRENFDKLSTANTVPPITRKKVNKFRFNSISFSFLYNKRGCFFMQIYNCTTQYTHTFIMRLHTFASNIFFYTFPFHKKVKL